MINSIISFVIGAVWYIIFFVKISGPSRISELDALYSPFAIIGSIFIATGFILLKLNSINKNRKNITFNKSVSSESDEKN